MQRYTFGPVASRRFGVSLGIDLSPGAKSCNFDCLYCELPAAVQRNTIEHPPAVAEIVAEVKAVLATRSDIDVLTITANGEPTLYPDLQPLIDALKTLPDRPRLLILSNGSTIADPAVQNALAKLDTVKLSLDCAGAPCFKKLDRPLENDIEAIIAGMESFRRRFSKELVIEILVVKGINDTEAEFALLRNALTRIAPDRIDLGTIDRPPAYAVEGVSLDRLGELAAALAPLPVAIAVPKKEAHPGNYDRDAILATLQKRPWSEDEAAVLLDSASRTLLHDLVTDGTVETIRFGEKTFYKPARKS